MTKKEYIDFIRNSLQMVDQTQKYHREQVAAAINLAVNTVFWELYQRKPRAMERSMERYTTQVSGSVTVSEVTQRYITTLDLDVVDLPKVTGGIIEVSSSVTNVQQYVPMSSMQGEQLYGAEGTLPGWMSVAPTEIIGYSWDGAREIEYWDMDDLNAEWGVVIRLIKQFRSYSLTDNVLMPYGQDQRIIELTRQYLGAIPPKDLISDNADIPVNRG